MNDTELAEVRNLYRLQLGGNRLCDALRAIASGCAYPEQVAKDALNHKAPDPDFAALIKVHTQAAVKAERERWEPAQAPPICPACDLPHRPDFDCTALRQTGGKG